MSAHFSTMTKVLTLIACAALAVGCSSASQPTSAESAGASRIAQGALLPPGEGKTTYPLTLETPWGTSTLEKRPERIAVLSSAHDAEYLSLLGVTPVLAPKEITDSASEPWMSGAFPQSVETTTEILTDELPFEAIAKAKPDLIILTSQPLAENYEKLKTIAPVVGAIKSDPEITGPWVERFRAVATALDLSDAGELAIKDADARLAKVKNEFPQLQGKSINYIVYYGSEYGLILQNGAGESSEQFFDQLGLAQSPVRDISSTDPLSNEQIGKLNADLLLLSDNTYDQAAKSTEVTAITDLPIYKNLPVVKDGRAVLLSNGNTSIVIGEQEIQGNLPWAMARTGPLGQVWAAEQLAPILAKNIK